MTKVIVTGGAGFIGANLVQHLVKNNYTVIIIDKLSYASNLAPLKEVDMDEHVNKIDICNKFQLEEVFRTFQPEIVFHLAAESHVDNSINTPKVFIDTNIVGTYNLLEVSREYYQSLSKREQAGFRFVHVSTDEVYGDLPLGEGQFTTDTPYNPSSPYSASKAASDHLVHAWYKTYNIPTMITHCTNNYGPWQHKEKLIPMVINCCLNNLDIPVYGEGLNERDWIHVDDHCKGLIEVAKNGEPGQTYNFGSGEVLSNIQVVRTICTYISAKIGQNCEKNIAYVKDRPGHDRRYAINTVETRFRLSNWKVSHEFSLSIADVVNWYIEHENTIY